MRKEYHNKIIFEIVFLLLVLFMGTVYFHNPKQYIKYNYGLEFIKQIKEFIFM